MTNARPQVSSLRCAALRPARRIVAARASFSAFPLSSMAKIFARMSLLTIANSCYGLLTERGAQVKQREFPFLSSMPASTDATQAAVARCLSDRDAFVASLKARCGSYKQSWFAAALGVSSAYISQIKTGTRKVPDWMVMPFCALTGTNLLRQYRQLQEALRVVEQRDSDNLRTDLIALELRRAA